MSGSVALVTGVAGQDGSYLTELLLAKGYVIHGIARSGSPLRNIAHLVSDPMICGKALFVHFLDLADTKTIRQVVRQTRPNEIYHLAAQSHVRLSFADPALTHHQVVNVTKALLEIAYNEVPEAKFFHASSAEIFGATTQTPQNESTPFNPVTPYGEAKALATDQARSFREKKGFFVCNGILYNHESPRRGKDFVTQKIARAVAGITAGSQNELVLGNTESRRDWGHAKDYVGAMWMMLMEARPDDYVVATGVTHTVKEFATAAFNIAGLDAEEFLRTDSTLKRSEDPQLVGDAGKIRSVLGWEPTVGFEELVREMVEAELAPINRPEASG